MANDDVDDIFKDFEHKVEGKEEGHIEKKETRKTDYTKPSEEEILKRKYQKAEQVLKGKYKKEKGANIERNIERFAYIAVILVLVVYISIDLTFYHGNKSSEQEDRAITAAAVKQEDETNETEKIVEEEIDQEPAEEEVAVEEEKTLSGEVKLNIDKIHTEVVDKDKDLGYIEKVVFTIDNGKETSLKPILLIYAYDSELDQSWETRVRGQYIGTTIKSGEKQTGSIELSPKTFKNLDLKKSIRLTLNDTENGFITAVNEKVLIE